MRRELRSFPWDFAIPAQEKSEGTIRLGRNVHRLAPAPAEASSGYPVDAFGRSIRPAHYLASRRKASMTDTVQAFSEYAPQFFPLPHPSWRSAVWMKKHPWFEKGVIPELRKAVAKLI
jgi:hypothetical protein